MIDVLGVTFPPSSQWQQDECDLIDVVQSQINQRFPDGRNLLINTTWFGPQFTNSPYYRLPKYAKQIDRVFFLASVDAVMLNLKQLKEIVKDLEATDYYIGNFDTEYQFTFIATLLPKYFKTYTQEQLILQNINHLFINYNRKPREHRVAFVEQLITNNLHTAGIVTLGRDSTSIYSTSELELLLGESPDDYAGVGNWNMGNPFGVPHDIHSLGNMDYWQNHFLNIVGETEFNPWDNMFITEKTWKPILGLRPFIINGQTKIYEYLRTNGFRTFNHYWPVDVENIPEYQLHSAIVDVIKYLQTLTNNEIMNLYNKMLPDLLHNQKHFYAFVRAQQNKIGNLFQ